MEKLIPDKARARTASRRPSNSYQNAITDTRGRMVYCTLQPQLSNNRGHSYRTKNESLDQTQSVSHHEPASGFTRVQLEALDRQVEQDAITAQGTTPTQDSIRSSLSTDSTEGLHIVLRPSFKDSSSAYEEITSYGAGAGITLGDSLPTFSFNPGDDVNPLASDTLSRWASRKKDTKHSHDDFLRDFRTSLRGLICHK